MRNGACSFSSFSSGASCEEVRGGTRKANASRFTFPGRWMHAVHVPPLTGNTDEAGRGGKVVEYVLKDPASYAEDLSHTKRAGQSESNFRQVTQGKI